MTPGMPIRDRSGCQGVSVSSGVQRGLGTADAVVLGLSGVLGVGVFGVWSPATMASGSWLPVSVLLAGVLAACGAISAARLTGWRTASAPWVEPPGHDAVRQRLGEPAGRMAAAADLVAKLAVAAAAAAVFGQHVLPGQPAAAVAVVLVAAVLGALGVRRTAGGSYALVGGVLAVLLVVVAVGLLGSGVDQAAAEPVADPAPGSSGVLGVLTGAGLMYVAFSGVARITATGAGRTRRRVAVVVLLTVGAVHLLVAAALLMGLGPAAVAADAVPLVALVDSSGSSALGVLVRVGAAAATGSALLGAVLAAGRTIAAMAGRGEVPGGLAAVSGRGRPWRADLIAVVVVVAAAALLPATATIPIAVGALLVRELLVHAAATGCRARAVPTPAPTERRLRAAAVVGGLLAVALLVSLPLVGATVGVLVAVWLLLGLHATTRGRRPDGTADARG